MLGFAPFHLQTADLPGPDGSLSATARLEGDEPFLADHFPGRPVLPGTQMLTAAAEAASWWVRARHDTGPDALVLDGARALRFARVVVPGEVLEITVRPAADDPGPNGPWSLQTDGSVDGETAFRGRLTIGRRPCPAEQADAARGAVAERARALGLPALPASADDAGQDAPGRAGGDA